MFQTEIRREVEALLECLRMRNFFNCDLGYQLKSEATLAALTEETVKSSAIEGEELSADSVRSSLARRMGLEEAGTRPADRHVEGVVEMMLDATQRCAFPLTEERIFGWHAALFPTGRSGMRKITTGAGRSAPMEVVSGPEGNQKVHFKAPPAELVEPEMKKFLSWYEDGSRTTEPLIKAGLAHLYFVTIHPLEDGKGRITRAITEMSLARLENSAQRFYSLSSQILDERKGYYEILESTQRDGLDVTGCSFGFWIASGAQLRKPRISLLVCWRRKHSGAI